MSPAPTLPPRGTALAPPTGDRPGGDNGNGAAAAAEPPGFNETPPYKTSGEPLPLAAELTAACWRAKEETASKETL